MGPHRVWTPESIKTWQNERDERRKGKGQPPTHTLGSAERVVALESERQELIETEFSLLSTQAWDVGKHPFLSSPSPFAGFLLLPKNYLARDGIHRLRVRKGDDLNRIVHQFYDEFVDPKTYLGDNYVSKDGIDARRHEYLGPNPRIASYRFTLDEIEIEWWEDYIKDTWIGSEKWEVKAEFDEVVEGWFLVDRNDY